MNIMERDNLTMLAKSLRKKATDVERFLWRHLRGKHIDGMKFSRQQPLGKYIVDLVCWERKLIVEIDGGQHTDQHDHDAARDAWLRSEGFAVLRFWNHEVLQNIEGVLTAILNHPPHTPPLKGGDRR
jgi:very-short-patch-repair endonuclease